VELRWANNARLGSASYVYNAEDELMSTAGVNYKYDGDGKRVAKSSGKTYWYGGGSDPIAETDASGNTTEYIFLGGRRIARRDSAGNIVYYNGGPPGDVAHSDGHVGEYSGSVGLLSVWRRAHYHYFEWQQL
jgi:YD repeat-containing protein